MSKKYVLFKIFPNATEISDLSIGVTSTRPLLLLLSRAMLVVCETVVWQLGLCGQKCLVILALYFNGDETLGTRAGQVFAYSVLPSFHCGREVQEDRLGESRLKCRSR